MRPQGGRGRLMGWLLAAALAAVLAAISLLANVRWGWMGLVGVSAAAVVGGLVWHRFPSARLRERALGRKAALGTSLGIVLGSILALAAFGPGVGQGQCNPGYLPCIPISETLDCSDIKVAVRVIGADENGLDRDGDGVGCETFG